MILRPDRFSALCINNQYEDFGNHTGFRYKPKIYCHLIVGEWYDFIKDEDNKNIVLLCNTRGLLTTGYNFGEVVNNPNHDFYKFFSSVAMQRDIKLNQLL